MQQVKIFYTYTGAMLTAKTLINKCPINEINAGSFARIVFTIATAANCKRYQQNTVHTIKHKYPLQREMDLLKASMADLFSMIMTGIEATRSEVKMTKTTIIMRV